MDIFPFRFWFFSAVFCTFQGASVSSWLDLFPSIFTLFNPIINQIVFLIYFPYCSLLVYRNVTHLWFDFISFVTGLNHFISSHSFFFLCVVFKGFQHIRACHLQTEIFLVLPSQFRFFFLCPIALARTSCSMLNKSIEAAAGITVLFGFRRKLLVLHHWVCR